MPANIGVYLFQEGTLNSVPCDWNPSVRLWAATNNDPAQFVGFGTKRMTTASGKAFAAWDFNDVDVSTARDPLNKIYLFVTVDEAATRSNVWSHGADARTYFPTVDTLATGC